MATPPNHGVSENDLKTLLDTVRRHGAQIAELEDQRSGRSSIEPLDATLCAPLNPDKYIRMEAYDALLRKYHELSEQNHELSERCGRLQQRGDELQHRYHNLKLKYGKASEIAREWKNWYDRQKQRQDNDSGGTVNPREALPTIPEVGPVAAPENRAVENSASNISHDEEPVPLATPPPALHRTHPPPDYGSSTPRTSLAPAPRSEPLQHPSSQSTEVPASPPPAATILKRGYSSDEEPTVILARTIRPGKRIKPDPGAHVRVKPEPVSQDQPIELDSGDFSSPHARTAMMVPEISDLDSGLVSGPPRKSRNHGLVRVRSRSEEYAPRATSTLLRQQSSLSQSNEDDVVVRDDLRQTQAVNASVPATPGVLQQISGNIIPAKRSDKSVQKRRRFSNGFYTRIGELSEDGDGMRSPRRGRNGSPKRILSAEVKQRLNSLLDGPSPIPQLDLTAKTNPPIREARRVSRAGVPAPNGEWNAQSVVSAKMDSPSVAARDREGREHDLATLLQPRRERGERHLLPKRIPASIPINSFDCDPPRQRPIPPPLPRPPLHRKSPKPPASPLRTRRPANLRLDDFKINPRYQDTDFAFTDTLRGRDARRCLPGCTKPDCCGGAFRKAVELAGGKGPSHMSDAQVLEAYLGPNWELTMGSYGPAKRKEVLLNAQTASFANEFGKHKTAFARHSTPPGFWTADFPDTQEAAEYRALASQLEKEKVEERYREAMRQNGRWIFRDES